MIVINAPDSIHAMALKEISNKGINQSKLTFDTVASAYEYTGEKKDILIFAMVVSVDNEHHCFNYYPHRKVVSWTYTLKNCDPVQQVKEIIASLRRLHA